MEHLTCECVCVGQEATEGAEEPSAEPGQDSEFGAASERAGCRQEQQHFNWRRARTRARTHTHSLFLCTFGYAQAPVVAWGGGEGQQELGSGTERRTESRSIRGGISRRWTRGGV